MNRRHGPVPVPFQVISNSTYNRSKSCTTPYVVNIQPSCSTADYKKGILEKKKKPENISGKACPCGCFRIMNGSSSCV